MKILSVTPKNYQEGDALLNATVEIVTEAVSRTFEFDLKYFYNRVCDALPINTSEMTLTKVGQCIMYIDEQGKSLPHSIYRTDPFEVFMYPTNVKERFLRNDEGKMMDTWSIEERPLGEKTSIFLCGCSIPNIHPTLTIAVGKRMKREFQPITDVDIQESILDLRDKIFHKI